MPKPEQLEGTDSEIVNRINTAYRKILVVGKSVFVPPVYSVRRRPYEFHVKQLRFLHFLAQSNDFNKACEEAQCSPSYARKFLKSQDYQDFARETIADQAIQDGWNQRRVMVEIDRIYRGERVVTDTQLDALKMMKEIVVPKKHELTGNAGGMTLNLNFPVLPAHVQTRLKALADEAATIQTDVA